MNHDDEDHRPQFRIHPYPHCIYLALPVVENSANIIIHVTQIIKAKRPQEDRYTGSLSLHREMVLASPPEALHGHLETLILRPLDLDGRPARRADESDVPGATLYGKRSMRAEAG